ncbi:heparan-alpha-glucosaminide N-acetyltransferase domain-containing protein, partial [Caldilinea sp.]|uniref:heparan-alpha-glucosaminide N-acetyltransferase domain-containing protein n=1 Tax=Caldilinea sp. TaxID=2293560 RepID=UPI002D0EE6C3|nr:heparan-alpha-glucosaminide N-acetyltransferase domain-containing protein [Caldilinea sp.]
MATTTAAIQKGVTQAKRVRFWEIDALRGVAIITMIVYHTMWDLWYWRVLPDVVLWEGFWKYWQRFTAGTFLILVGVSLTLVYRRERAQHGPEARLFPKFLLRGLKIFGLGMIITLVVTVAGVGYVDFGIL